jgi:hypothetical protein
MRLSIAKEAEAGALAAMVDMVRVAFNQSEYQKYPSRIRIRPLH